MKITSGSKLLFIGDSITDCGRARPVSESNALGEGYVNLVNAMLGAVCPQERIRVVNMGNSGNTVRDLKGRWQTDVLDLQPDWLSIMIGINDVWRQFDSPLITECHVEKTEYDATLDELVAKTAPTLKGMVLMTPFYIEPNSADAMRALMDEYGAVVREVAEKHNAIFVDTQAAFNKVLEHTHSSALAWDRVHPRTPGHMVIARAFLNAIGFSW